MLQLVCLSKGGEETAGRGPAPAQPHEKRASCGAPAASIPGPGSAPRGTCFHLRLGSGGILSHAMLGTRELRGQAERKKPFCQAGGWQGPEHVEGRKPVTAARLEQGG